MKTARKSAPAKAAAVVSSVRYDPEDRRLIAALQKKTGVRSVSDITRMGLRALADKENVK